MIYSLLSESLSSFGHEDLEAINSLLKRLSPNSPILTEADLERISAIVGMHIVLAKDPEANGLLVGMARLIEVPMLVGHEAVIEDVVVSQAYEGRGIGKEMMLQLLKIAQVQGVKRVVLTTWPDREAANRLYLSLGFEQLSINYYRKNLR